MVEQRNDPAEGPAEPHPTGISINASVYSYERYDPDEQEGAALVETRHRAVTATGHVVATRRYATEATESAIRWIEKIENKTERGIIPYNEFEMHFPIEIRRQNIFKTPWVTVAKLSREDA